MTVDLAPGWMRLKPVKDEEDSEVHLIIPDAYKDATTWQITEQDIFEVVQTDGDEEGWIQPGDYVLLEGKMSVHPTVFRGELFCLARCVDVVMKLEDEQTGDREIG